LNILPVLQGSAEWLAVRANYQTASEAPAAMGQSKHLTRTGLIHQKHTGLTLGVGRAKQALFDRGHETEAAARPIAEAIVMDDLYPVTATLSVGGIELLASFDGATMDEEIIFEHKLYSESLAADVRAGTLAPHYTIQMDQLLLVSGAKKCLFMTSDGTENKMAWCWYESSQEKFDDLIAGWKQFNADLAAYAPQAAVVEAIGHTPETLPALRIEVTGRVTASNLAEYKAHALSVFARINRELKTDQQFADAEKVVKWCGDVESRLAAAKQHALSQTQTIDALFRTIDDISAEARQVRLEMDKLVKTRKEAIRGDIVARGVMALRDYLAELNLRLGKPYMPAVPADFGSAIKGKRTIESLNDAVNTELARAKTAASGIADRIQKNLETLCEFGDYAFLFSDTQVIALKAPDDLIILVKSRIADHQQREATRLEAVRERIRSEEQAKAQREAEAAQRQRLAEECRDKPQAEVALQIAAHALPVRASSGTNNETEGAQHVPDAHPERVSPSATVLQIPMAAQSGTARELSLSQIGTRLGFALTPGFMRQLGFEAAGRDGTAMLYDDHDFCEICAALVNHIAQVQLQIRQAA
jgi:predicted phage-related endonuclease